MTTRVVVINPGDVLLIGNVKFAEPKQLSAAREMFQTFGLSSVVFFASDIEVDKLNRLQLLDLVRRAERHEGAVSER